MKKTVYAIIVLVSILAISSCDYDDSNDIDLIIPTDDTTETGITNDQTIPMN